MNFANTLQPAFRHWFYPAEIAGEENVQPVKNSARARIEKTWDRVNEFISDGRPYLLGEQRTAADFYLTMLMRWSRNMPKPATHWPHLNKLAQRMKALSSFKALYASEGLTEWE